MAFLKLEGIAKSFDSTVVLRDISLSVEEGETLVLLGPSGSGKTTLLRIIAGFETADRGRIEVDGESMGRLAPAERNLGMVFQHYALFPHLSVGANVAFGLEARGMSKQAIAASVESALERVDLTGLAGRRIDAISGGQQQRVALARALAPSPRLLLLDEPLSNLDPELRERTRQELARTLASIGITAVWVTHEQEEAFDVGTSVAVLNGGRLEQLAAPEDLYRSPETPFVAAFVGRASVLRGRLVGEREVEVGAEEPSLIRLPVTIPKALRAASNADVDVFVRPETWQMSPDDSERMPGAELIGEVISRRFAGRESLVTVRLDHGAEVEVATERDSSTGDRVRLRFRAGAVSPAAFAVDRDRE